MAAGTTVSVRNSKTSKNKPTPMCERLLKALGLYPKIIKLSSQPNRMQEEPKPPVGPAPSYSQQIQEANYNGAPEMEKKQKPTNKDNGGQIVSGDVNEVFSDYISRAKRRLGRNISSKKRHDDSNLIKDDHRFSDYIVRARNKLKATTSSNVGWTKSISSASMTK